MVLNSQYSQMGQLGALPTYVAPNQTYSPVMSVATPGGRSNGYQMVGGPSYASLTADAAKAQQLSAQQAAQRQNAVIGGYDQQIANSRRLADQGYQTLATNYEPIVADAAATRERNMARVDQYGNSMRQDLDIKAKQAMAVAAQSAIKRGLGSTTIYDSLQRGQNFDNTRQKLTLEDQLLQNRISTDTNLSGAYQSALQNRAQGLASQWNQNMATENQLTGNRLGYIGGIQDDSLNWYKTAADLYSQQLQMNNANEQAALNRQAQAQAQAQAQSRSYSSPQVQGLQQVYHPGSYGYQASQPQRGNTYLKSSNTYNR